MSLIKVVKTLNMQHVQLKADREKGGFSGYACVFGGVDSYGDTVVKGAFLQTLAKRMPKMFYDHRWDIPIGKFTLCKEDDIGLYVEGELTPGLSRADDVRAALLHGTLDGLSVGGWVSSADCEFTEKGKIIRRWTELIEVSPTIFPADDQARIDNVKSWEMGRYGGEYRNQSKSEELDYDLILRKLKRIA